LDAWTTIHVINHDPAVRDSLKLLLELCGHRVEAYGSGECYLLDPAPPRAIGRHCILLDLDMPGMGGFEMLEALRGQGSASPVIVITGRGNGVRPRIEAAGAALLEKPFGQSALLACIDAVLAGR
jgi:two-component system response regulator FixJ